MRPILTLVSVRPKLTPVSVRPKLTLSVRPKLTPARPRLVLVFLKQKLICVCTAKTIACVCEVKADTSLWGQNWHLSLSPKLTPVQGWYFSLWNKKLLSVSVSQNYRLRLWGLKCYLKLQYLPGGSTCFCQAKMPVFVRQKMIPVCDRPCLCEDKLFLWKESW